MTVHQIRLHGPWEVRVLDAATPAGLDESHPASKEGEFVPLQTIDFPKGWIDWLRSLDSNHTKPTVELARGFGCPSNLTESQTVLLVLELENCSAEAWLHQNLLGQILSSDTKVCFPIRRFLLARNRLRLLVNLSDSSPLVRFKNIRLEIVQT